MSLSPLINLAGGYLQSLLGGNGSGSSTSATATNGPAGSSSGAQTGNQLSPFAQILSTLQQLQQSSAPQYQQVTQQISTKLQTAAQAATTAGASGLASELTQLSTDFSTASSSGQIPNIQDLAQAIGAGHGHHHHHHGDVASGASTPTPGTDATSGNLSQYIQSLAASQSGSGAATSLNPLTIISSTLSSAGIIA